MIFVFLLVFKKLEEGEIGFLLKRGQYRKLLDKTGFNVVPPFISKVMRLDYTDYNWKQEFREIAMELDLSEDEIESLKEEIKDKRDKKV